MTRVPKYQSSQPDFSGLAAPGRGSLNGYTISGTVVNGNHLGRTLGFPTANIQPLNNDPLAIPNGVYLVSVLLKKKIFFGLCNIGNRPTIGGTQVVIEVNILDFSDDIYGTEISITIIRTLRKEKKFKDLGQLASQLQLDKAKAMKILSASDKNNAG